MKKLKLLSIFLFLFCCSNSEKSKCNEYYKQSISSYCDPIPIFVIASDVPSLQRNLLIRCLYEIEQSKKCNKKSPILP